jgi:hypothetical protein
MAGFLSVCMSSMRPLEILTQGSVAAEMTQLLHRRLTKPRDIPLAPLRLLVSDPNSL